MTAIERIHPPECGMVKYTEVYDRNKRILAEWKASASQILPGAHQPKPKVFSRVIVINVILLLGINVTHNFTPTHTALSNSTMDLITYFSMALLQILHLKPEELWVRPAFPVLQK